MTVACIGYLQTNYSTKCQTMRIEDWSESNLNMQQYRFSIPLLLELSSLYASFPLNDIRDHTQLVISINLVYFYNTNYALHTAHPPSRGPNHKRTFPCLPLVTRCHVYTSFLCVYRTNPFSHRLPSKSLHAYPRVYNSPHPALSEGAVTSYLVNHWMHTHGYITPLSHIEWGGSHQLPSKSLDAHPWLYNSPPIPHWVR